MGFGAVAHRTASEVVTLDTAGKTLALGSTRNINKFSSTKYVNADGVTDFVFRSICKTHLANELYRADACLLEMAFQGFVYFIFFNFTEAELYCIIAVGLNRLVLDDDVVARLYDRNRDNLAFFREDLSHTKFST